MKIGKTQMAFVDQHRDELAELQDLWEDVSGGLDMINIGKFKMASRHAAASTSTAATSRRRSAAVRRRGGRLHRQDRCCRAATCCCWTNPRTTSTWKLRALEDALLEFAGSVMVISHDRWFLDRIATHIPAPRGRGQVGVLRRQLPGIRSRQAQAPRRRRCTTAPGAL